MNDDRPRVNTGPEIVFTVGSGQACLTHHSSFIVHHLFFASRFVTQRAGLASNQMRHNGAQAGKTDLGN
jgi:hypothetical protein